MSTNTARISLNLCAAVFVWLALAAEPQAGMKLAAWTPLYQGVDFASGTNTPDASYPRRQVVYVMRIDLSDPDVELFTDPHCANCSKETVGRTTSQFLEAYKLHGAVNYSFFAECCSAPSGSPMDPYGLLVSEGNVVSPAWTPNDFDSRNGQTYFSTLLFDAAKNPTFIEYNWPATNLAAIHTAIAGSRTILKDGQTQVVWGDHIIDPRVSIGISQDGLYLYMLVLDGRQGGYSDGANDRELGEWLKLVGAWNALNVDGGGSTTMVKAQCFGKAVQVNRPINGGSVGNERVVAGHFGFRAKPVPGFINDIAVQTGSTAVTVTWTTLAEATGRVDYGLTAAYGSTVSDPSMTTTHAVPISGLKAGTNYYLRITCQTSPTEQYVATSCFTTTNTLVMGTVFDLTNTWKYTTQNLDGVTWQAINHDDSRWPAGPGLLCVELDERVQPKGTQMPANSATGDPTNPTTWDPFITYYFRTHFTFTNDPAEATLIFSNYLDDGAVFYLNGVEIQRVFMPAPPTAIYNATLANYYFCRDTGDATCPYLFSIAGDLITNLVQGDNVLAVEVHNYHVSSPDIAFGTALLFAVPPPPPKSFLQNLAIVLGEADATLSWNTESNATTQVEYGLTTNYTWSTALDTTPRTNHTVRLEDLAPGQTYYFRAISTVETNDYIARGFFSTVSFYRPLFLLTNTWRYSVTNMDNTNWTAPGYLETSPTWRGPARALLHVDSSPDVHPKNTTLPSLGSGRVYPTYYFRTKFKLTNEPAGLALCFSNFVDDGAVFYLNGREIQRLRMPPAPLPITYTNQAIEGVPYGHAIYPDVFRVSGDALTNLVQGDNVLAVEVHQYQTNLYVVFGSSVGLARATAGETKLRVNRADEGVSILWDGLNLILQQTDDLQTTNTWADVPGPVRLSPYTLTNPPGPMFYRLRNVGRD